MARKRIRTALALGGAGVATALVLAGSASAWAGQITVRNINVQPGGQQCATAAATTSFAAVGSAQSPGLRFKLLDQSGNVITSTSGPVTGYAPYIYPGAPGWEGPQDYTVCAKNTGTQAVLLNYLTVQGN